MNEIDNTKQIYEKITPLLGIKVSLTVHGYGNYIGLHFGELHDARLGKLKFQDGEQHLSIERCWRIKRNGEYVAGWMDEDDKSSSALKSFEGKILEGIVVDQETFDTVFQFSDKFEIEVFNLAPSGEPGPDTLWSFWYLPGKYISIEPGLNVELGEDGVKNEMRVRRSLLTEKAMLAEKQTDLMRAWQHKDKSVLNAIIDERFVQIEAWKPDEQSAKEAWLATALGPVECKYFKFDHMQIELDKYHFRGIVTSELSLTTKIDEIDTNGTYFITDLWENTGFTWHIVYRAISKFIQLPPSPRTFTEPTTQI